MGLWWYEFNYFHGNDLKQGACSIKGNQSSGIGLEIVKHHSDMEQTLDSFFVLSTMTCFTLILSCIAPIIQKHDYGEIYKVSFKITQGKLGWQFYMVLFIDHNCELSVN